MGNVFLTSDTHFSHKNLINFKRVDGSPLRPFSSIEEMDEKLIENWNSVVKQDDKVYHLGDVAMSPKGLGPVARLNGRKILIKGNHDIFKQSLYSNLFKDIRAYHIIDGMILSHVPIHPLSFERFSANIHGHLHDKRVMMLDDSSRIDPRYYCVSVEHTEYRPIALEELKLNVVSQGGKTAMLGKVSM